MPHKRIMPGPLGPRVPPDGEGRAANGLFLHCQRALRKRKRFRKAPLVIKLYDLLI